MIKLINEEPGANIHACNPSYSRGRDQEDNGLKPVGQISSPDHISNNLSQKRAGRVVSLSPSTAKTFINGEKRHLPH
jgi:hypothetical protein